ncbi:MAG: hypothetical protein K6T88_10770 [Bacillus sp. (in: Bacteria)]|nr:hypothetical protein [Bacillus sp. (in: firmicutes)]
MNMKELEQMVKQIQVRNLVNADVEVVNESPLVIMGKGRQGAVFQVTDEICVKVFGNTEDCEREYYALTLGQETDLFPKLYGKGQLYIAMEIITGVDLREYLQSQPLSWSLSAKLIEMLITFKKIGYERIDHHKRQIYVLPSGDLKVIDVARTVWRDRVYPYPRKLLNSLGEENKALFLAHVEELAPEVYLEWQHYIRLEEISQQITKVLLPKELDKETLKKLSTSLLTTEDESNYLVLLEGLVHKVFKEEWIKTMLARGEDLEKVMAKIDKYWDKRELGAQERSLEGGRNFEGDSQPKGDKKQDRTKRFEGERQPNNDRFRDRGSRFRGDSTSKEDQKHDKDHKHDKKDKHVKGQNRRRK